MTDRELLELAAKAAGYEILFHEYGGGRYEVVRRVTENNHAIVWTSWNPLTDDGDALRLAVKLGVDISTAQVDFYDKHSTDPYAATRRAITRAAAEIGKRL